MKSFAVVYCLLIAKVTALPITQLSGLEGPSPLENEVDDSESFIDVLHINENKGDTNTPSDITTKTIIDIWNDNNFASEVVSTTSGSSETDSPFKKVIGFGLQEYTTTYEKSSNDGTNPTEKQQTTTGIYEEISEKIEETSEKIEETSEIIKEIIEEIKETQSEEDDDNNSAEDSSIEIGNPSKTESSDESSSSSDSSGESDKTHNEDKDDCVPSNCDGVTPVYVRLNSDDLKETQSTPSNQPLDSSTNSNIELENRFAIAGSTTEYVSPTFGHFTSNIVTTPAELLDTRNDEISTAKSVFTDGTTENEVSTSEIPSTTQKYIDITTYRPTTVKNVEIIVGSELPTTYTSFLPTTEVVKSAQLVDTRFSNNLRNEFSNDPFLNSVQTTTVDELESRTKEEHPGDTRNEDISTAKSAFTDGTTENEVSTSEIPSTTQKYIDITTYRPATVKNVEIIVGSDPPTTYTSFLPTTELVKSAQLVDSRFSNNLGNEISNEPFLTSGQTTTVDQLESRTNKEHPVDLLNTFRSEPTTERFINEFRGESSGLSIFSKFANSNFGYKFIQPEKKKDSFVVKNKVVEEDKGEAIEPAVFNGVFSFGDSFGRNRFANYATHSTTTTKPGSFGSIFNTISKRYQSPYKYSWSFSSTPKNLPDNSDRQIFSKSFLKRLTSSTTESYIQLDTINLGNTGSIQRKTGGEIADYKGLHLYNPSVGKYL